MTMRAAQPADGPRIAELIRDAKADAMPWLREGHSRADYAAWVGSVLLSEHRVVVAVELDRVVGVVASRPGWIDQLFVGTGNQGTGIGSALLADALLGQTGPVQLWVFARNVPARRFYERHGFLAVRQTDGLRNEEGEPDVLYRRPRTGARAEIEP